MSTPNPKLVVRRGPNPNHVYPLQDDTTIIGREPANDAMFPDPEVSRRHCRIVHEMGEYFIEDFDSTNGTFVNGRRITEITRLSSGDIIDFGETVRVVFVYTMPSNGTFEQVDDHPALAGQYGTAPSAYSAPPQNYPERFQNLDPRHPSTRIPTQPERFPSYRPGDAEGEPRLQLWQSWIIGGTLTFLVLGMCICGGMLYYLDTNYPDVLWGWLTG